MSSELETEAVAERRARHRQALRRGVYALPMSFTVGNLFCGFLAVMMSMEGRFEMAAALIFAAMVLDGLDGRVARLTNTSSEFGEQYDSLADVVSFGIAPAMLVHAWLLHRLEHWGLPIAFMFLVCGSMRLARFNIQVKVVDKRYFVGLPIPMGAAMLAAIVLASPQPTLNDAFVWTIAAIVVLTAYLMISTIRYFSFKDVHFRRPLPIVSILVVAAVIALIQRDPPIVLLTLVTAFVLSGPLTKLWRLIFRRRGGVTSPPPAAEEPPPVSE